MKRMCLILLLALSCKSVSHSVDRRHTAHEVLPGSGTPSQGKEATQPMELPGMNPEQQVSEQEINSVPKVEMPPAPTDQIVMVPELGSQCAAPVTAKCLGIDPNNSSQIVGLPALAKAVQRHGRAITKEVHKCNYYSRNLATYPNISYFVDGIVYWKMSGENIVFASRSVNFIFAMGCSLDDDFKNPYASQLSMTQDWDGVSTLRSLNYKTPSQFAQNFAVDQKKAAKLTQGYHKCDWAVRPLIYAFPDGVGYQLIGGETISLYSYNQVKAMGCVLPPAMVTEAEKIAPKCGLTAVNPDPLQRKTLTDLGLLPTTFMAQLLDQETVTQVELNGIKIAKTALKCPLVSTRHDNVLQFSDGIAIIDAYCGKIDFFTNEYLQLKTCTIPELPKAAPAQ